MTLLGGDAAALFGELLAGEYLPAMLHVTVDTYDGEGKLSRTTTARPCRAQVERATERMAQAEGYTAGDRAVYVLARPPGPLDPIDALDTGAEITIGNVGPYAGQHFKIGAPIDRDPAGAYWLARGTQTGPSS